MTLPPGTRERIPFTVRLPAGTAPRQYLAGITAELANKPPARKVGQHGQATAKASIVEQVTVGVHRGGQDSLVPGGYQHHPAR